MIITNKFVLLHLHKSGGTYLNRMIMNCIPYAQQIGYHLPYSALPPGFNRLNVLGTVRNPWAYYVSWYHFQYQMTHPNPLFMLMSQNGTLGFEQTITNLLQIRSNQSVLKLFCEKLPVDFQNHGINLTKSCLSLMEEGIGFYSFLYRRLYQGVSDPIIIKTEDFNDTLFSTFKDLKVQNLDKIASYLNHQRPINTSEHLPYQHYYSTKLKTLVSQFDAELINKYRYHY